MDEEKGPRSHVVGLWDVIGEMLLQPVLYQACCGTYIEFVEAVRIKYVTIGHKKRGLLMLVIPLFFWWAMLDSNQRPPACKAGALNQLS